MSVGPFENFEGADGTNKANHFARRDGCGGNGVSGFFEIEMSF